MEETETVTVARKKKHDKFVPDPCRGVGLQAEQRQAFGRLSACARRWWELGPGEFGAIKTKRRTMVIRLRLLPDAGFQRVI
jgi:hypothetical protein